MPEKVSLRLILLLVDNLTDWSIRGRGLLFDFGRYNGVCHTAMADFEWSQHDKDHFDRTGELPRQVWEFDPRTPVVLVDFIAFRWMRTWHPCNIGRGEQYVEIAGRPLSLVLGDCYPKSCMHLEHARFLLPSDHLPAEDAYCQRLLLRDRELLDIWTLDESQVVDTILEAISGEPQVSFGNGTVTVNGDDLCHDLQEVHQAGVEKYVASILTGKGETAVEERMEHNMEGDGDKEEEEEIEEMEEMREASEEVDW